MSEEAIYKLHRHGDTLEEFEYVQELIRCKDCRWQSVITDEEEGTSYYMCGIWAMPTDEDVFCSHGKRK